jgi:hypothetical protein
VPIVDNVEAFRQFVWSTLQETAQSQAVGQALMDAGSGNHAAERSD